jgi:uncharacterized repeat protein (TIGR01451 family)
VIAVGTSGAKTENQFRNSGTEFRKALLYLPAFILVFAAGIAAITNAWGQDNFPHTAPVDSLAGIGPTVAVTHIANVTIVSIPQTIDYTITIENIGSGQLSAPAISDTLTLGGAVRTLTSGPSYVSGDRNGNGKIGGNEIWTYAATYAVTQADLDASGSFSNVVTFTSSETGTITSAPAVTTATRSPSLSIIKNYTFGIDGGLPGVADAGDVIAYTYAVTNNGNVSISGISVDDVHSGTGQMPQPANETLSFDAFPSSDSADSTSNDGSWSVLAPGDTVTFTANYTVTQTDVDNQ